VDPASAESPSSLLRRYLERLASPGDPGEFLTGPRAAANDLLQRSARVRPLHADERRRVHVLEIGDERIERDVASVPFRALEETTIAGRVESEPAYVRLVELSGPAVMRRTGRGWAVADYETDGRTAQDAVRVASGRARSGPVRVRAVATSLWPQQTGVHLMVHNGTDVRVGVRAPEFSRVAVVRGMVDPELGSSSTREHWVADAIRSRTIDVAPGASQLVTWFYGDPALPGVTTKYRLDVGVRPATASEDLHLWLRVRLRNLSKSSLRSRTPAET
jgi:hypothetical protein